MNQKMTVINGFGKKVYCVLSEQEDFENQLSEVFSIRKGLLSSTIEKKRSLQLINYPSPEIISFFSARGTKNFKI